MIAFFIFLQVFSNANAQQELFDAAVDYCNCRITYAYLKGYVDNINQEHQDKNKFEEIKNNLLECKIGTSLNHADLSKLLLKDDGFPSTDSALSKIIDGVKKKYSKTLTLDDAVNEILVNIYDNKNLSKFIGKYNILDLRENFRHEITTYFKDKSYLSEGSGGGGGADSAIMRSQIDTLIENKLTRMGISRNDNLWVYLICSIFCLAAACVFFIYKYKKLLDQISSIHKRMDEHSNAFKLIQSITGSSPTISARENAKAGWQNDIEEKISDINIALGKLQAAEIVNTPSVDQVYVPGQQYDNARPQVSNKPKTVLYAPVPNKDGSFTDDAVSAELNPTASFYKFTLTDGSSTKATFEFLNEERAVRDATNAPDRILRPVCKINNPLNQNAKRIVTTKPGIVVKKNDKWVLDTPAEIRYE